MSSLGKADTAQVQVNVKTYPWAQNKHKCEVAAKQVLEASKIDPAVKFDEATIKERYIELKGVLNDSPEADPANRENPGVTAKGGIKITTKGSKKALEPKE